MIKKTVWCIGVVCLLSLLGMATAADRDLLSEIGRKAEGASSSNWKVQEWLGKGGVGTKDPATKDPKSPKTEVYKITGAGDPSKPGTNRIVFWVDGPLVQLQPGKKYQFTARLKLKDVKQMVQVDAAIRAGGVKDVIKKIFGTKDWEEHVSAFEVNEECVPRFFAIDFWGPGTIWISDLKLIEKEEPLLQFILPLKEFGLEEKTAKSRIIVAAKELPAKINIYTKVAGKNVVLYNSEIGEKITEAGIDISSLKEGKYEILVELIKNGKVLDTQKETIIKAKGAFDE